MYSVCVCVYVIESHVTVNYTKILGVAQQCFMVYLCHQQQCKLNVPVFESSYSLFQVMCTFSHVTYESCIEIIECSFVHELL